MTILTGVRHDRDDVILEARDITMRFGIGRAMSGSTSRYIYAADHVSVSLRAGRVVALVGESGSGKSTVARILAQMFSATSGQVLLHGRPVHVRSERSRRAYTREVQMLLQDPFSSLNPLHTLGYTLARAVRIHRGRIGPAATRAAVAELLARVKMTPAGRYVDKFPHELSGGQLQRVAIARTLAASPSVLLLDEPVSMLDVSIRVGVLNLLAELKDQDNLALLYITHDIASARYFADEMVVMYHGQMVEGGTSEQVTQSPAHPYTELLISSSPDPYRSATSTATKGTGKASAPDAQGCPFASRCPHAMDVCVAEQPPVVQLGGGHWARCWLYRDPRDRKPEGVAARSDAPDRAAPVPAVDD